MGVRLDPLSAFLLPGGLLALGLFVFARVRSDYRTTGALSRPAAVFQTGFFFAYAFSAYLFIDSRLTAASATGGLLVLASVVMSARLVIVLSSMPFLGKRSFGREIGELHTSGICQYSRNPQLTASFVLILVLQHIGTDPARIIPSLEVAKARSIEEAYRSIDFLGRLAA